MPARRRIGAAVAIVAHSTGYKAPFARRSRAKSDAIGLVFAAVA
jgi:hypothetical protein